MNEQAPAVGHNRDQLILQWDNLKKSMAAMREQEQALRKEIVAMEFAGAKKGTNRVALGNGYALKAVIKYNYKVTKNEAVEPADYSHIPPLMAQLPAALQQTLIKWTPEVSVSTYNSLTEDEKKIANQFILITDGSSELELEMPKVKAAGG